MRQYRLLTSSNWVVFAKIFQGLTRQQDDTTKRNDIEHALATDPKRTSGCRDTVTSCLLP